MQNAHSELQVMKEKLSEKDNAERQVKTRLKEAHL